MSSVYQSRGREGISEPAHYAARRHFLGGDDSEAVSSYVEMLYDHMTVLLERTSITMSLHEAVAGLACWIIIDSLARRAY